MWRSLAVRNLPSVWRPARAQFAELHCKSNFSFLQGASHAEELVRQAHALGYAAIAITDECSLAGVVRAHAAARGLGVKLIVGAEFRVAGGKRCLHAIGAASAEPPRLRPACANHHLGPPPVLPRANTGCAWTILPGALTLALRFGHRGGALWMNCCLPGAGFRSAAAGCGLPLGSSLTAGTPSAWPMP